MNITPIAKGNLNPQDVFIGLNKTDRTLVVIDNYYLNSLTMYLGYSLDLKELRSVLANNCDLQRIVIGSCMKDIPENFKFGTWLAHNGFFTQLKFFTPKDDEADWEKQEREIKNLRTQIDTAMLIDTMSMAYQNRIDHLVMLVGNNFFVPLVNHVRNMGIKTTMVTLQLSPAEFWQSKFKYSNAMRKACEFNWELNSIIDLIESKPFVKNEDRHESIENLKATG